MPLKAFIQKEDWALSPLIISPFLMLGVTWHDIPEKISVYWNGITALKSEGLLLYLCFTPLLVYIGILFIIALLPAGWTKRKIINNKNNYMAIKCAAVLLFILIDMLIFGKLANLMVI